MPYRMRHIPRHEAVRIRGLEIHLTRWGPPPAASEAPVLLLHGWQDTGDTFQFMVDALQREWPLVALDWRGFGRSEWPAEGYWFPDYLADLDALLDEISPGVPARLIGHSMGGNVAGLYAGLRPERVRCFANLEGFGLPRTLPEKSPRLLRKWLDQVKSPSSTKHYASVEQLATVIRHRYTRFTASQAAFVAAAWSTADGAGVRLVGDPRHRWVNPVRYQREDAEACWREVTAPVLLILGDASEYLAGLGADGSDDALRKIIPHMQIVRIAGAGHMLHIERAAEVAKLIEDFMDAN